MLRRRKGYLERLGSFYPHWMGVFSICVDKVLSSLVWPYSRCCFQKAVELDDLLWSFSNWIVLCYFALRVSTNKKQNRPLPLCVTLCTFSHVRRLAPIPDITVKKLLLDIYIRPGGSMREGRERNYSTAFSHNKLKRWRPSLTLDPILEALLIDCSVNEELPVLWCMSGENVTVPQAI